MCSPPNIQNNAAAAEENFALGRRRGLCVVLEKWPGFSHSWSQSTQEIPTVSARHRSIFLICLAACQPRWFC